MLGEHEDADLRRRWRMASPPAAPRQCASAASGCPRWPRPAAPRRPARAAVRVRRRTDHLEPRLNQQPASPSRSSTASSATTTRTGLRLQRGPGPAGSSGQARRAPPRDRPARAARSPLRGGSPDSVVTDFERHRSPSHATPTRISLACGAPPHSSALRCHEVTRALHRPGQTWVAVASQVSRNRRPVAKLVHRGRSPRSTRILGWIPG